MKLIRNLKIRAKLLLVVLPLALSLVAALVFGYVSVNKVQSELTLVYRDSLYEVNNYLLSADRDYYQSLTGAVGYFDINMNPILSP